MEIPVKVVFPQRPAQMAQKDAFRAAVQVLDDCLLPHGETLIRGRGAIVSVKPSLALYGDPTGEEFPQDLSQRVEVVTGNPFVKVKILFVEEGFGIGKVEDLPEFPVTDRLVEDLDDEAGDPAFSEGDQDPFPDGDSGDKRFRNGVCEGLSGGDRGGGVAVLSN